MLTNSLVMEYGMDTTKMSESHYPEALRRVYFINGMSTMLLTKRKLDNHVHRDFDEFSYQSVHHIFQLGQNDSAWSDRQQILCFRVIYLENCCVNDLMNGFSVERIPSRGKRLYWKKSMPTSYPSTMGAQWLICKTMPCFPFRYLFLESMLQVEWTNHWTMQSLQGGEVPRSYYMTSKKLQPTESMECVTISNGAKKKVEIPVSAVNSILRWNSSE